MFVPGYNIPLEQMNGNNQNLFYKINDFENRLKKLEQRITRLENEINSNSDSYPEDNSLYMM